MVILNTGLGRITFLARQYCELVDCLDNMAREDWLHDMAELLPNLHEAIDELHVPRSPNVVMPAQDLDDRFELFSRMYEHFGEREGYDADFDGNNEGQRLSGTLADDLTDIYFDLRRGLDLLDRYPDQPNIAINEWQRSFRLHWQHHLNSARRQLEDLRGRSQ